MSGLPIIPVLPTMPGFFPAQSGDSYALGRAKHYASKGEKIIDRAYFWHGLLGRWSGFVLDRLAAKLDRVTDEIEGFLALQEQRSQVKHGAAIESGSNVIYFTAGTFYRADN